MTGEKVMPSVGDSYQALADTLRTLLVLGIPSILDGGTLLGFYRDGTFCADDHDDIDLTVPSDYWRRSQEIIDAMKAVGFDIYHEWPRNEQRHVSGQVSFKRDNVKIDLMFKEMDYEKGKVWWTVYGGPRGVTYKAVPLEMLETATLFKIALPSGETIEAGMPGDVEDYLAYRYGDFREPVHRSEYSCYTTDRCIVQPNTYEAI